MPRHLVNCDLFLSQNNIIQRNDTILCYLGKRYKTRDEARQAIFNYIEMFYNPKRRHTSNERTAPAEFDRQYFEGLESV